jgi:choline kinase
MAKGLILAAGRGSRMKAHTDNKPKCLTKLAGQALLFWQLSALSSADVTQIAVVTGYRGEAIRDFRSEAPVPFILLENPRWAETNMLATMLCAVDWAAGEECLISYSDIVYPARHVLALTASRYPVALTYDRDWEKLWRLRNNGDPLEDAETFLAENGLLLEIGAKAQHLEQVRGQYMGLLKLTPEGWRIWLERCRELGPAVDTTDMTGFLRLLLADGAQIGTVPVGGAWCEVDNERDLALYEAALTAGTFSHDWRERE